jgi:hypothetical protein
MKIYLKNYLVGDVMKNIVQIDKHYYVTKHIVEIFSDEGIFQVTGTKIYKWIVTDVKVTDMKLTEGIDLIVDKSTVSAVEVYQIPSYHIAIPTTQFIYQIKPRGVQLIIEGTFTSHSWATQQIWGGAPTVLSKGGTEIKYIGFVPSNFYFEVDSFDKERDELNVFLSLLM